MKVAWLTTFPVEWLPDAPEAIRQTARLHPAPWQRVLLEEFEKLPNLDLELHVLVPRRQFAQDVTFRSHNTTFHCLKQPPLTHLLSMFWWETLLIRRRLREIQPDLLHAWGTERGSALVAARCGYPYMVTMHGLLGWIREQVRLPLASRLEVALEPAGLRRASLVTVESSFGVNWLRQRYPQLELRQIEHSPHRVFFQVERRPQLQPVQFLFIGLLSPIKGADLLLHGLDKLCKELDFHLTYVGPTPPAYLKQLKASTSLALWNRVSFKNGLSPREVAAEMSRATMLLLPTRADNSPNSVKEAIVAGLPVVGSAVGGLVDHINPGLNGLSFPAGNLEAFVTSIRAAVAHPVLGQGKVDPATLAVKQESLSPKWMAASFLAAYRRMMEKVSLAGKSDKAAGR